MAGDWIGEYRPSTASHRVGAGHMRFKFKKPPGEFEHTKDRVQSVPEFLECVKSKWHTWMEERRGWEPQEKCPWFRGVTNEDYRLVPSIYRAEDIGWRYKAHQAVDMQAEFARRAKPFIDDESSYSDGEYLHLMQHYGFPTRLLDWTEGSLIALYFAIRIPTRRQFSPCVWMLNPSWLNFVNDVTKENVKTGEGKSLVLYTDRRAIEKYDQDRVIRDHYLQEHSLAKLPVAVFPPYIDRRIVAQKSVFTIHGIDQNGFDELCERHGDATQVCKIRIAPDKVTAIKEDLTLAGVTETTIFPDLEGLSREIQAEYGMPLGGFRRGAGRKRGSH